MKKKQTESLITTEECIEEIEEGILKLQKENKKLREENNLYKESAKALLTMCEVLKKDTSGEVADDLLNLLEEFDKKRTGEK